MDTPFNPDSIIIHSYYTGASTSVYYWSLDGDAFASCWLIKKEAGAGGRYVTGGSWDSMHVIEARPSSTNPKRINYKITTTCMVSMQVSNSKLGNCSLSGSIMREVRAHIHLPPVLTRMLTFAPVAWQLAT